MRLSTVMNIHREYLRRSPIRGLQETDNHRQIVYIYIFKTLLIHTMYRLFIFLKCVFPGCSIVTVLTTEFNSIMDRFQMLLKATFSSCLIVTILAKSTLSDLLLDSIVRPVPSCTYGVKSSNGHS